MAIRTALLAFSLLLAVCSPALAQGSREDYERAMSLAQRTNKKVLNAAIEPHWLDGGDRMWYRRELSDRRFEFILVDIAAATRRPAFDHQRMASVLAKRLDRSIHADRLPIESLDFSADGKSVTFVLDGQRLACDLDSYELRESEKRPAKRPAAGNIPIRPSRDSSVETSLTVMNQTAGEIELFWIDSQGNRKSYGKVAAGQQHEQHTFVGHTWIAVNGAGKVLASFQGEADGAEVIVDGKAAPATAPTRDGRRRAGGRDVSPDGRYRAFIRDNNVFLRDLKEDREFALSTDGTTDDAYEGRFFFSPDSSRLIVLQTKPAEEHKVNLVESSPRDQVQPKLKTIDYLKAGDRIAHPRPRLFDLNARKRIDVSDELFANPWRLGDFQWDADSSRFTFLYNQRGHQVLRVVAIDGRSGKATALIDEKSDTFIDYSNKTYFQRLAKSPEIVWMSERSGWNHLYLIDAANGKVKNAITSGSWVVKRVERIDETARQVWFWAVGVYPDQDPYYLHLGRVNLDGTGLTWLTAANGTHKWDYSPDGKHLLATWSRVDQPPVTELRRASDGKLVCELERADASASIAAGYTVPERFSAKGRDGKADIFGVIYRPSNFDPAKKYPVVEEIYAGPHDAFVPKAFGRQNRQHAIAELGFIVVQIDGMGTNWRSRAFHDVAWKNLADAGFEDRIRWIKAAAERHPEMDLTRVGIYGGSAGGQNALAGLLLHGDFYKAGVADCGCHDNRMDKIWWNEAWMGWPVGKEYAENSNVTHAGKLKGKLLLIAGELDTNVDPASTMQVVNALVKANKDFDLLIIPGQGHGAAETSYGSRRRMDFLVRNLIGKEPRWAP